MLSGKDVAKTAGIGVKKRLRLDTQNADLVVAME
jgi:hypothetical protein